MTSSLIPERPILLSPSLAATIGLEEATMLSVLDEITRLQPPVISQGFRWFELSDQQLYVALPFWNEHDIQRVSQSLRAKGILLLQSAPFLQCQQLIFAFNELQASQPHSTHTSAAQSRPLAPPLNQPAAGQTQPSHDSFRSPSEIANNPHAFQPGIQPVERHRGGAIAVGATPIPPSWQPNPEVLARISQHNIPEHFIREQLPEFVTFWRESGETQRSWGAKFHQHVIHQWRQRETFTTQKDSEVAMTKDWRPSPDALDVLTRHAAIHPQFIEDAVPEFVLYWAERGGRSRTWNTKFIQHVRRQWARYTSALEHDTEPKRIPENWQPGDDVHDILRLANIDVNFALQLVPEFVIFWRDSNQVYASWNTKFLQHVKYHWAKRHSLSAPQGQNHEGQQTATHSSRTRDRTIAEDLNDRSWAF
ncbi:hypothetical protein G8770_01730 [Aestuariicella hydrocarbonica]|uniref:DnaT DNA-binding domain-containing protein n=1 Tax=Pseudomaricurvus hydrocarbonicus TaxID=1470433 RepID=A0A9E5MLN7_9GAMM|nr:DnaT-like ssDNA-binding domain-containing protein [Aestuariicella hydrocarbonica]NHO64265.1 hypothetical protein [Aestuariicella hydrocarbonica]